MHGGAGGRRQLGERRKPHVRVLAQSNLNRYLIQYLDTRVHAIVENIPLFPRIRSCITAPRHLWWLKRSDPREAVNTGSHLVTGPSLPGAGSDDEAYPDDEVSS